MRILNSFSKITTLILSVLIWASAGEAKGKLETKDFHLLLEKAQEATMLCLPSQTLIVLDIDNTLLTMHQDLGSDAWFNWQADLVSKNNLADAVASDLGGLLKIQGIIFSIAPMRSVEPQNPKVVRNLQDLGYPTLVLTSRGLEFQDSTFRELSKSTYDFSNTSIGPKNGYAGKYLPYDLNDIQKYGITPGEVDRWKLTAPKAVAYQNGVFFGAGQHKGAMLKTILAKTEFHPCAIVFIDDTLKHTERVWGAFESTDIDMTVIRYGFLDEAVKAFVASDKHLVTQQWRLLKETLEKIWWNY